MVAASSDGGSDGGGVGEGEGMRGDRAWWTDRKHASGFSPQDGSHRRLEFRFQDDSKKVA